MPADVERLLRTIAPALLLLGGCDAKPGEPAADVVAKTPEAPERGSTGAAAPDSVPKLDLPSDEGAAVADPELPVEEKPEEPVEEKPEAKPKMPTTTLPRTGPARRPMPTCPSGTWCTDKSSAKKHAVRGTKTVMGCAENITPGAKGLDGPLPGRRLQGLSKDQTKARREAGPKDACCYAWFTPCPGGRPLMNDAGVPVVAAFEPDHARGWSSDHDRLAASPEARAFAAQAWVDDAAMEHASVASFGRVALELLSLGAPPELIEGAHRAALDEIRHAKTCLSLARACGAGKLEPGPLASVPQRSADFARFAADTFIEGCAGETIAALVVTRAGAGAQDPKVRQALEQIAADEAGHAALAWRMV